MRRNHKACFVTTCVIGAIAFLASCTNNVEAERCGGMELVRAVMLEQKQTFTYFALQHNEVAEYTLFIADAPKASPDQNASNISLPWVLVEHRPDDRHCVKARGDALEPLNSLHDAKPRFKFGMPGSGNPRCSDGTDVLQTLDVRLWANHELGESVVFNLESRQGKSYVFLLNTRSRWILLESDSRKQRIVCYLARGESVTSKTLVPRS